MILICGGAKAYGAFGITKLADAVIQTAKSAVLRFSQNNACYLLFLLFSPELLAITNFMEVWWPMDGRSTANLRTKLRIGCLRFLCRQGEKISKAKSAVLNPQFLILQSVAILSVLIVHKQNLGIQLFTDWFPFASFHMPLFVFISGYFFKPEAAEKAGAWLWKKARSLLLPFYIWNLIYGILITVLLDQGIVSFGYRLSFYTYFIKPWLNNPGAGFNLAAWFVPALFLVMLIYIFLRKLKSFFTSFNEYLFLALLLAIGLLSVYSAAKGFRNSDGSRMLVRCGFLLPFYQIGYLYRSRWESKDRLGHFPYFLIIFTVQFVLFKCFGSVHYNAWNAKFPQGIPWLPFAASITGIFFWLRISRILTPALKSSRLIRYAGQNTWTVMMHHSISFFLMNCGLALLAVWGFLDGFDWTGFREEMWYTYIPGDEHFVFFYLLIGMVFPLTIKYLYEKMILYLNRKINWTKIKI